MKSSTSAIIFLAFTASICSCATNRQSTATRQTQEEEGTPPTLPEATPTREDFVPLAPPVLIDRAPEVTKKSID